MSIKRERENESLDFNDNKRSRTNSSTKIQDEVRFINALDSDVKFTKVTDKEKRHLEENIFPTIDSEHMEIIEVRGLMHKFLTRRYFLK